MLLSSLLRSGIHTQLSEGEMSSSKARRRRKKTKGEEAREIKKRRLSDEQVKFLEMNFGRERKLESGRKVYLASELGLNPKQVAVWFQNRRARWKSKQLEEVYVRLKTMHDAVVVEKCHLEAEVRPLFPSPPPPTLLLPPQEETWVPTSGSSLHLPLMQIS